MNIQKIKEMEILDFEKEHNLNLSIKERSIKQSLGLGRYYCSFNNVEVVKGSMLHSLAGSGDSIDEAIQDYANFLSGEKLKINNVYIDPIYLKHTKLLNQ